VTVRAALHVAEGDEIEFTVTESGEVMLHGLTAVPANQRNSLHLRSIADQGGGQ